MKDLGAKEGDLLRELNALYSHMANPDPDRLRPGEPSQPRDLQHPRDPRPQIYYQVDKDWHYRKEERRWIATNDKSGWQRVTLKNKRWETETVLHSITVAAVYDRR